MHETYSDYIVELKLICKKYKINLNKKILPNNYDFYYIKNGSPEICISAGIHGNEKAGSLAVLDFLKTKPKNVLIFPCINPYGFDKNIRNNDKKQDINRRFYDKVHFNESKIVINLIKNYNFKYFISLHEWYGAKKFHAYVSDKNNKKEILKIIEIASKHMGVYKAKNLFDEKVEDGLIWYPEKGYTKNRDLATLENHFFERNVNYICTETPMSLKIEKRVCCQLEILKFVYNNFKKWK